MVPDADLVEFFHSYVRCALWSSTDSTDEGGEPLDKKYDVSHIHPDTLARMKRECLAFLNENLVDLTAENCLHAGFSPRACAGSDFFLTRNGHGAGFWDGGWAEDAGSRLARSAKRFGPDELYIGDDGMIHGMSGVALKLHAPADVR